MFVLIFACCVKIISDKKLCSNLSVFERSVVVVVVVVFLDYLGGSYRDKWVNVRIAKHIYFTYYIYMAFTL